MNSFEKVVTEREKVGNERLSFRFYFFFLFFSQAWNLLFFFSSTAMFFFYFFEIFFYFCIIFRINKMGRKGGKNFFLGMSDAETANSIQDVFDKKVFKPFFFFITYVPIRNCKKNSKVLYKYKKKLQIQININF